MLRTFSLLVSLSVCWLLWSGIYDHTLLRYLGAASCLLVIVLSVRMRVVDREGHPIEFILKAWSYLPWLLKEIAICNIDVTKAILFPKKHPISPTMFEAPTSQKTALGHMIYANSVTLTPGTITLRVDHGRLLVHALTKQSARAVLEGTMDRKVRDFEAFALPHEQPDPKELKDKGSGDPNDV